MTKADSMDLMSYRHIAEQTGQKPGTLRSWVTTGAHGLRDLVIPTREGFPTTFRDDQATRKWIRDHTVPGHDNGSDSA